MIPPPTPLILLPPLVVPLPLSRIMVIRLQNTLSSQLRVQQQLWDCSVC